MVVKLLPCLLKSVTKNYIRYLVVMARPFDLNVIQYNSVVSTIS